MSKIVGALGRIGLGLGAGVSTDVNIGNGQVIPGSAIASAAYAFYKKPSAEGAANAAMGTVCSIATAGAASSNICGYFTVANMLAAGDWFADAVLKPAGLRAQGVYQCTFSFPDVARGADMAVLALQTALDTSWYATREAMGLPFKPNGDAVPRYETTTQTCKGGYCYGQNSTSLIGKESKRVLQLLAADKDWKSYPSVMWGAGPYARRIFLRPEGGQFDYGMDPGSSPFTDCHAFAPQFNALLGSMYLQYRLEPAKKAAKQVLKEWGSQFDAEYAAAKAKQAASAAAAAATAAQAKAKQAASAAAAARASQSKKDSQKLVLALLAAGVSLGVGAAFALKRKS